MVEKKFENSVSLPSSFDMGFDPEQAKCECCGLCEECTPAYISCIREVFCGRFVCGLCAEAVKEEQCRMKNAKGVTHVSMEGALQAHMAICEQFKRVVDANPAVQIAAAAAAMRQLLVRRTLGVQRSSQRGFGCSSSCIPAMSGKCRA
ncbi:hypothetical protein O6H91_01G036500 [Diphasiastrum complanatum]|uniref:Uncharacterized protein n=1 Tax=Diphasiastrum complanatum TaxID=34168 RepID=A0ACC2EPY2_DIPCM|nr:hypothetical protein O6H91_Y162700 [Diphasiastrum complanatum]KAJ7568530.1 hypothetical protein O6H91_01G036500 [Diphasiastrum complanatum]